MKHLVFSFNLTVVSTRSRCILDAGLEALECQDEVYMVLPIRGVPGCYSRQLVGLESVSKGG